MGKALIGLIVAFSMAVVPAFAAGSVGSVAVDESDLFTTRSSGKSVVCARLSGRWVPGKMLDKANGIFLSHAQQIKNKTRAIALLRGSAKAKALRALQTLKAVAKAQGPVCRRGPPSGTPTPSPSATPVEFNFDSQGNVTAKGKSIFGIPSYLAGNISTGRATHQRLACTSCHGEATSRSYSQIMSAISSVSAMSYILEIANEGDIAEVTAYLNRFRN